jgi:hypothetical protein
VSEEHHDVRLDGLDHPVAVFFICIVLMLAGMTVWEIKSPTVLRKGFLPIATTRGDRLFIGLLGRLREPGLRGGEREDDRLVRPGAGAVDLDQLRRSMALLALIMRKGLSQPLKGAGRQLPRRPCHQTGSA